MAHQQSCFDNAILEIGVAKEIDEEETFISSLGESLFWPQKQHHEEVRLDLNNIPLFGRSSESNELLRTFSKCCSSHGQNDSACVVTIHGPSGSGKSKLVVDSLREIVVSSNGYFCSGKFCSQANDVPFSAIAEALGDLCDLLLQQEPDLSEEIQNRVGDDLLLVLTRIIPSFEQFIQQAADSSSSMTLATATRDASKGSPIINTKKNPEKEFAQVKTGCQRFLASIQKPLVLFLDDIQWADESSLELISFIIAVLHQSQNYKSKILLICAFRDEDEHTHKAQQFVNKMQADLPEEKPLTDIVLRNLDLNGIHEMVSYVLQEPPEPDTPIMELSQIVEEKTDGSPFFALQFLQMLEAEGFITRDESNQCWVYDSIRIWNHTNISINICEDLLKERILRTPKRALKILRMASCFGFIFDAQLLAEMIYSEFWDKVYEDRVAALADFYWERELHKEGDHTNEEVIIDILQHELTMAAQDGVIEALVGEHGFKFSHDKLQFAFYNSIQKDEKDSLHLLMGRFLGNKFDEMTKMKWEGDFSGLIFSIADHMNRGSNVLATEEDTSRFIEANLVAARLAQAKVNMKYSRDYLLNALNVLKPETKWLPENVRLTLELSMECACMHFYASDFEACRNLSNEILERLPESMSHNRYKIRQMLVDCLVGEYRVEEAIEIALQFLREDGYKVQKKVNKFSLLRFMMKLRKLLHQVDDRTILSKPCLDDEAMKAQVDLIYTAARCAGLAAKEDLYTYLTLELMAYTLNYGLSENSPQAFARFAMMCQLYSMSYGLGFQKTAKRASKLSFRLLDKVGTIASRAKVESLLFVYVEHWHEHINPAAIPRLERCIELGLSVGDIGTAVSGGMKLVAIAFAFGTRTLAELVKYNRSFVNNIEIEFGQHHEQTMPLRPYWQAVESVYCGEDFEHPTKLKGDVMDESVVEGSKNCTVPFRVFFRMAKLQLCYVWRLERSGEAYLRI